jgi:hypothetical protein
MGCVEALNYEILIRDASFKECRDYIRNHFPESIDVEPGFKIFDVHTIGVPPIAVGLDGDFVIFPYTKPCHGTFLLRVQDAEESARLRALKKGLK